VFAPPAMKLISRSSQGLTRRINILADKSLLAAFADGTHQVTAKHARAAIRDSEFGSARRGVPNAWWFVGAGLAAGLLVGVGLHLWNQSGAMRGVGAAASQVPVEASVATAAPAPRGPGQDHPGAKASPDPEPSPAAVAVSSTAPAAAVAPAPTSPPPELAAVASTPAPPVATPIGARPPASGKLAQERFAATQKWLKTAPSGTWTIQLMTAGDSQAIERFLEEAAQTVQLDDMYLYGVKQNGRQYYGVTYGSYPTLEDTITAMGDLPTSFKSRGPFHRSIGVMRRQNQE
jgi:septal ring-binding cell division protein DamX